MASNFRMWRRSRPFWGGLLLLIGGLEMLLIPLTGVLARGQIKLVIYVGIGGVFGILIGALLIACGLALWFTPMHKTFYAIAGVLLSLLSFIGTNLGGFFVGMLLGIVGGSLAFAWSPGTRTEPGTAPPARPAPPPEQHEPLRDQELSQDQQLPPHREPPGRPADFADGGPGPFGGLGEPRPDGRGWRTSRSLAVAALLALAVAAGALTGAGHASAAELHPAHPATAQSGQGCILLVICTSPSPTPTPSASATPSPSSGSGLGGVLPISGVLPSTGASLPVVGSIGSAPGSASKNNSKTSTGTQGLVVSSSPAVITATSATLNGLAYQGKVNLPVNGGGTVTMMKFTMNSQQLSGLDLTVTGTGGTLTTAAPSASFSGRVVLYATKLTGQLAGVPLTLTPDNAESTLLQLLNSLTPLVPVTLTDVTASQPVVLGNSGAITSLAIAAS
jgi:Family of unknown function (DUF6114)